MKKIITILLLTILVKACSTFPETVSGEDANKVLRSENGIIINVTPVRIKGQKSEIGVAVGAAIGGIAGSKISTDGREQISQVLAVVGGAIVGYYVPVVLGEHNGFAYTVEIEDTGNTVVLIQGKATTRFNFQKLDLVTITYGSKVMIIPR